MNIQNSRIIGIDISKDTLDVFDSTLDISSKIKNTQTTLKHYF